MLTRFEVVNVGTTQSENCKIASLNKDRFIIYFQRNLKYIKINIVMIGRYPLIRTQFQIRLSSSEKSFDALKNKYKSYLYVVTE